MVWYAELGPQRARQVIADLLLVVWVLVWRTVAGAVRTGIETLGAPGRGLVATGERVSTALRDAADAVANAPVVGELLAAPLRAAAESGDSVGTVGQAQADAALQLATTTGRVVFLVPVLTVGLLWLVLRVRGAQRLGALHALRAGAHDDLLALRALTGAPPAELLAVTATPVEDWRAGLHGPLAALELQRGGLRPLR